MIIELNQKTIEAIVKTISVAAVSLLVAGVTYTVTTLHNVEKKQDLIDYKLDQVSFVLQDIYENKKDVAMYPPWIPRYKTQKTNSGATIKDIGTESIEVRTIEEMEK